MHLFTTHKCHLDDRLFYFEYLRIEISQYSYAVQHIYIYIICVCLCMCVCAIVCIAYVNCGTHTLLYFKICADSMHPRYFYEFILNTFGR